MTRTIDGEPPLLPPTLDHFLAHLRSNNPFAVNRVVPSSTFKEDVPQIHHKQFTQLVELAGKARQQRIGVGVMLWGEAGIGKSHLLARLASWAEKQRQALFVYLANLQAQPEQLPRSLLKCVLSILTRGRTSRFHGTPLYRWVNAALRHALQDDQTRAYSWDEAQAAYQDLVDGLAAVTSAQAAVVDRSTYEVIFRFFRSVYLTRDTADDGIAARAVRWLGGDFLDPDEARSLGIHPGRHRDEAVALADDEQIKKVLIALAQMASYRQQVLILCFDQVDNLEPEQFAGLVRFLHALLDGAANLLVITSGVRPTISRWESEGVIQKSSWDRLAQYEVELQRVGLQEARQIVQARLQPFQETYLAVEPIKDLVQMDDLFPIGETWAQEFLAGKIEVRPRDVISWAREGWRRQQETLEELGGPSWLEGWKTRRLGGGKWLVPSAEEIQKLIDDKVTLLLDEHRHQRHLEPQTLPPDADNLAGLLHTLLERCLAPSYPTLLGLERRVRPRYGQRPPHQLILQQRLGPEGQEIRTGILCLSVRNRTSLTAFLRRLVHDTQPPQRLFLVTDERCPLDPAPTGREYLERLRQRYGEQFQHIHLTFDQYAQLDALQATVGLARSGDLEIELPGGQTHRVSEEEVIQSHHRQRRYLAHPLLRLLLGEEFPAPHALSTAVVSGSPSGASGR